MNPIIAPLIALYHRDGAAIADAGVTRWRVLVKRQIGKSTVGWKGRLTMPGKLPQGIIPSTRATPSPCSTNAKAMTVTSISISRRDRLGRHLASDGAALSAPTQLARRSA